MHTTLSERMELWQKNAGITIRYGAWQTIFVIIAVFGGKPLLSANGSDKEKRPQHQ